MSATQAATSSTASESAIVESSTSGSPTTTREIYKNGWLKKFPPVDRRLSPFAKPPKPEKMWVVFCIHDDVDAFLEVYENRRSAFTHKPTSRISLAHCLHISPNIVVQDNDFIFSITLDNEVVKLAAQSREQMMEWMDTLRGKLTELGFLQSQFNIYSPGPQVKPTLAPLRDPMSPLPPPPSGSVVVPFVPSGLSRNPRSSAHSRNSEPSSPTSPGAVSLTSAHSESNFITMRASSFSRTLTLPLSLSTPSVAATLRHSQPPTPTSPSTSLTPNTGSSSSPVITYVRRTPVTPPSSLAIREDCERSNNSGGTGTHFTFDIAVNSTTTSNTAFQQTTSGTNCNIVSANSTASLPPSPININGNGAISTSSLAQPVSGDRLYEPLFLASSCNHAILGGIRNPNYFDPPQPIRGTSTTSETTSNPRQRQRARSEDRGIRISSASQLADVNHTTDRGVDENSRPLTLKEKQVFQLSREIQHRAGVRLLIPKKDCINAIAFVDCCDGVWIAGWKQRDHPSLYHSFHIGDRIIAISGHNISSSQDAHKIIKGESSTKVEIVIGRVPFGQVFVIKREFEGQELGLTREGNTAEIVEVVNGGLAARHGLPAVAQQTCEGDSTCNWFLTEVNGRPLNLFFKDNEVHDRLHAVGKDISILVQPSDFIKALKKQLKAIWGYKDYIVQ